MRLLLSSIILLLSTAVSALGKFGDWTHSVALSGYISGETGKAPNAYMWIPESSSNDEGKPYMVKFAVLAQQNMTEETVLRSPLFRQRMQELGGALIWVAPAFSQDWSPQSGCQQIFEEMMDGLAGQSGHPELSKVPIVPFGHSAQATFPWNFAAWNPQRTLAIISFHGDAPRTNLCGYGGANVEWGRNRNIDGIPGLMVEGEYEWWDARVRPALAFQIMYPEACISLLCDAGAGHFDCPDETIDYIARFIKKAVEQRLGANGNLRKVNKKQGCFLPAPNVDSDANTFWYFDEEMANLTQQRYDASFGKQQQFVGIRYKGQLIPYDEHLQGGMLLELHDVAVGEQFQLEAVLTDSTHVNLLKGQAELHMDFICGPVRKLSPSTFERVPYDCGSDNSRRSNTVWLVAVAEGDKTHKRAVQPIQIRFK